MVVWVWTGEALLVRGGAFAACEARSPRELFHRGPLSEAGEGIWFEAGCAGMTVIAVDVVETAEEDAVDGASLAEADGSPPDEAMYEEPVPCWGRASAEDDSLDVDEGGEGKRDAPPVDDCCREVSVGASPGPVSLPPRLGCRKAGCGVCVVVVIACVCEAGASLTVSRERLAERLR